MAFSVIRSSRSLVRPSEQTPSSTLDLSAIDRLPVLRCNARTLHVFRHGPGAARAIREGLSRALVPYYPLAGRLKASSQGLLQIECCGEGVWYVEASADCRLDVVNYLDDVKSISYDELLPDSFPEIEGIDPLLQMQVTQFTCGGFVIGFVACHSVADGLGAAQFLNAVGELVRGLQHPTVPPVWNRDFFPPPPQQPNTAAAIPGPPPPMPHIPDYHLRHANVDISLDQINHLKQEFQISTGRICSTFEVLVASFWRSRTKSINFNKNTQLKLVFFANCRQLFDPPLPEGFYGNCFFPVTITASSDTIAAGSNSDIVKLIQEAKAKLPEEFGKYLKGENLRNGEDPFAPPLAYTTLFVSEWAKLGFNQIDYGWGKPVHVVPIQGSSIIPVGILGLMPSPEKGIRLMTWCVEDEHLEPFIDQIMNLI